MTKRPYRHWTSDDDAILRRLHAEGWNDTDAAYIMRRTRRDIRAHRRALGLPSLGRPGCWQGFKHTAEARAKVSEANRRRWQDPAYRATHVGLYLPKAREALERVRFRAPDRSSPEGKAYVKARDILGVRAARAAMVGAPR